MAEGEDDGQEKAHDATPRRLEKAREQGDIPRSTDTQTLAAYIGLAAALFLGGSWAAIGLGEALRPAFAQPHALAEDILRGGASALPDMLGRIALSVAPVLGLPALLILVLLIAQRSIVVAPDKLAPKLSRISPIANAKQKFGLSGLVEFAKSVVKVAAVAAVLYTVLIAEMPRIVMASALDPRHLGGLLSIQFEAILIGLLIVSACIAFIDFMWQRFEFEKRNRMTHQELKEEAKQTEGDPHLKAERRERGRALANQKMLHDVPNADVVVTNPTHYAVALKWDREVDTAPRCIAKGVDEMAHRIREIAEREAIPVHADAPTARSIHALVEIGQEVQPEHYRAVAAAILFADEIRAKARVGA
ncbi:MAG: flagellar type III secretion system protein FlhB [Pseudomonadota bacterium]